MRRAAVAALAVAALTAPGAASAADRWESKAAAPLPRQEAAFAELGGKLHLVGGFEDGGADSARHDVYDIAADAWSVAPPLPEPSHHAQAAVLDGKLYVAGGLQTLGFVVSGRMWMFDPATSLWSLRAGVPRGGGTLVAHGGRLLYLGGLDASGAAVTSVDAYDPAADAWTPLPPMPVARDHHAAVVLGGTLYVVGGRQAAFGTEVLPTDALDLGSMTWRSGLAPIPVGRAGFAAAAVGDEVVIAGGESEAGVHADADAFYPATGTWRRLAPMPLPRHGIQGAGAGGGLWIAGGGTDLLVAATAATDVLYPDPRPVSPILAPVEPPPSLPSGSSPTVRPPAPLTLRVPARVRRGARRVVVRVSASASLELRAPGGRILARARARRAGRVTVRVRSGLARGRHVVVARAGTQVVRRAVRVR